MQYRNFGKLDWKVSALGFGCMRFPTDSGNQMFGKILEDEAIKLIHYAIDKGVNYFDSAYIYNNGNSEEILGKGLKNGYRDKVRIATKSPMMIVQTAGDFDKFLEEQLKRLKTDHIDFYLLHGLTRNNWQNKVLKLNMLERAEAAKKAGKIGYIGFSFHDTYDAFEEIINGYDKWTFCQIQYNYLDTDFQAGIKGLKLAAARGLAVSIMEPLLGGKLANPPKNVRDIFNCSEINRTPAEWALQWIWEQPEVSVVLSGMNSIQQLEENLISAERSKPDFFTNNERDLIQLVTEKFRERILVPCTGCGYCLPCPSGVDIPMEFRLFNEGYMYENLDEVRKMVKMFRSGPPPMPGMDKDVYSQQTASKGCVQCEKCQEKCPQHIPISTWMKRVNEVLIEGKPY